MLQMPEPRREIREVIAAALEAESLREEATLEELGLDSLLLAEVVAEVERRANVVLDSSELASKLRPETPVGELARELEAAVTLARTQGVSAPVPG